MDEFEAAPEHERKALIAVGLAQALVIKDDSGYQEAGRVLVSIKDAAKAVTAFWDDPIKKARAAWTALTERRGAMLKPLEEAEKYLKGAMTDFHAKAEAARAAEEAAMRAHFESEKKAEQEALAAENELLGNQDEAAKIRQAPVVAPPVSLPAVKAPDRVSYREDWKAEVVDMALVPREFLLVDTAKLAKLARAMKADANVPGVRFYAEKIVVAGR